MKQRYTIAEAILLKAQGYELREKCIAAAAAADQRSATGQEQCFLSVVTRLFVTS